ncbi:MAG TPA: AlkA N-terminal domain-containing protein [Actinomycetota bacterium]|nr:AlkA N-terminal domain-containing protein [Actinomycetota bacterium]
MHHDFDTCYRIVQSRDERFDGMFVTGVTTTGVYCRPSCPAITPRRRNVRFYVTAAAAQRAGLRACKRCLPDATPGSPEWDVRADLSGRAMRLIADGVVDRAGVGGLASRLHVSERHLRRTLVAEVGAGPRSLARANRAHVARTLIETTEMSFSDVAFAAGFSSIRQFNETVRRVFASTPGQLRARPGRGRRTVGELTLRLPYRRPFAVGHTLDFLGRRAVAGVESYDGATYARALALPHGPGVVELSDGGRHVDCKVRLRDVRDLAAAVARCRRLLDLDADSVAIDDALARDPALRPLVTATPGLRVPGAVSGPETAVRAVLGQQVSLARARTLTESLVTHLGESLDAPVGSITRTFPTAEAIADSDLDMLGMPRARTRALGALCRALANGDVELDPGAERDRARAQLLSVPGIGPWTAGYVALRALGDPDVFLGDDAGARRAGVRLGLGARLDDVALRWRPWRSYALCHLWASLPAALGRAR